jgi:hypothetical protein
VTYDPMLLPWGAGATVSPSSPSRAFSQRRTRGTAADPRGRRSWTALGATPVAALASVKRRSRVSQRQRWDQLNHAAELGDVARTKEIFWEMWHGRRGEKVDFSSKRWAVSKRSRKLPWLARKWGDIM